MNKTLERTVIAFKCAVVVIGILVLWLAWEFGAFPNCGVESGYYGQFNRVRHTIERMPNVRIVDHWMHKDLRLEDFGFALALGDGRTVRVDFTENSAEMVERSKVKIRKFVEREIAMASKGES